MNEPTCTTDEYGDKEWRLNGKLHRTDGPAVEWANGDKQWHLNGKFHRIDGPAVERTNGHKSWWFNGKHHRTDGPAIELANGHKEWRFNGKLHRTDGPAIKCADGTKEWWLNGKKVTEEEFNMNEPTCTTNEYGDKYWRLNDELHRIDGPAIETTDGYKYWYLNGKLHRIDGPAVEWADGYKEWRFNGKLHRTDGPAIKCADGTKEWWLNGKKVTEEEFNMNSKTDTLQRQEYETGAVRNNTNKLRYDLIPVASLHDVAEVLTLGADKYGVRNWEKGFPWSNPYASLQRHLNAWWAGEDLDPETGLSHLAHACCNLMMLQQFEHVHHEGDDRPKGTMKKEN